MLVLHKRKHALWICQSLMQAIGKVCPVTTCQGSVVVHEFAARAPPPHMQRVSKRLPAPQIYRKTENTQANGASCV